MLLNIFCLIKEISHFLPEHPGYWELSGNFTAGMLHRQESTVLISGQHARLTFPVRCEMQIELEGGEIKYKYLTFFTL